MTKRILVADDSAPLLAQVGLALREAGYTVTSTNSGADALCLLSSKPPPDLLILDMNMPGIDGHDVLKQLGPSAPPVVVISGDSVSPGELGSGKVARVVLKPFDLTKLMDAVTGALTTKTAEKG